MSRERNATCAICGGKYKMCYTCRHTKIPATWRTITDSIDCYKVYMIIHGYTNHTISKEKAGEMIKGCTLPATLQDHIKAALDEILEPEKPS